MFHSTPKPASKRKQPDSDSFDHTQETSRLRQLFDDRTSDTTFHGFHLGNSSSEDFASATSIQGGSNATVITDSDPNLSITSVENYIDNTYNTIIGADKSIVQSSFVKENTRRFSCPTLVTNDIVCNVPSVITPVSNNLTMNKTNADIQSNLLEVFKSANFKDVLSSTVNEALDTRVNPILANLNEHDGRISTIESKLITLDLRSRENNLIISGVPEEVGEDVIQKIIDIASFLNIQLSRYDITECHRIGPFVPNSDKPRRILAQFLNKLARNDVYLNRGKLRNFSSKNIFVSEDLPRETSKLFFECRKRSAQHKFWSCYTKFGKCFIKETKTSRPIVITDLDQLNSLYPELVEY